MSDYKCGKCGITRPEAELDCFGWSAECLDDPECRYPVRHPRKRAVAELTTETLDGLEDLADDLDRNGDYTIDHAVLRALIDCARDALQMRAEAMAIRDSLNALRDKA